MTRTSRSLYKRLISCILIILFVWPAFSAENENWVVGAEKFKYGKGYVQNSVSEGSAEMLPMSILEKLSKSMERNVLPDEKFQRESYKLKTERQSLFLQLSNQYKKRDALMLNNYSEKELQRRLKDELKEIENIQKKIEDNIQKVKELQEKSEKNMELVYSGKIENNTSDKSEIEIIKEFFKNIFKKDESVITQERVKIYQDDFTRLFAASALANESGYGSTKFERDINSAKINTLITGTISGYGDYISVTVELYLYPGAKQIGTITEMGTLMEADLITSSIANQILPMLTNAMPVLLNIQVTPAEAAEKSQIFIDDVLQTSNFETIVLESGVHTIQFVSDGYRSAGTSYYFTGNTNYNIEVNFKEKIDGYLQIELMKPLAGDFFANGEFSQKVNEKKSQIVVNGNNILGEFIAEDGETAFYYVPHNLAFDSSVVKLNPKPYDREKNIDKRRRWMYASYSALIVSLIPTFYTYGNLFNEAKLYKDGRVRYDEAIKYQNAFNVCQGISIGCGVFFAYELVRYILAANAVLPHKARAGDLSEYEYFDPASAEQEAEAVEEFEEVESPEEKLEEEIAVNASL